MAIAIYSMLQLQLLKYGHSRA